MRKYTACVVLVLVILGFADAATRTWSAGAAGNWSTAANWSGGAKPAAGDDVVFDGTSVFNCTVDEAPANLNTFTIAVGYTGTFNDGGYAFAIVSTVSITPGGTFTASGTWTQTGDANWTYANSGTFTVFAQSIVLQGTGTLSIAKTGCRVKNITCAATGKTTTFASFNANEDCGWQGTLSLGGGTLTNNTDCLWYGLSAENTPFAVNSSTINGSGVFNLWSGHAANVSVSIPSIIAPTCSMRFRKTLGAAVVTFNMAGALSLNRPLIYCSVNDAAASVVFNTNNYAITGASELSVGNSQAGGSAVVNFGSSVVTIAAFGSTVLNTGPSTLNMDSSQWTVTGAWTYQSNHTINPGTSTVTFTGNSATLTGAGKSFNNIVVNKTAGQTQTFAGDLTFARMHVARGLISHSSGTIAWSNVVFPAYAGTLFTAAGGSGTITRCTFGASTTGFLINNAGSTYAITNCAFGTGTTGISKTNGTLTTTNNIIGATTAINGQALGAGDVAANPQLGNLPTGCVINATLTPFADGSAVGNLAACEFAGSGTYTALSINPAVYTSTGRRYQAGDKIPIGAMYALTTFARKKGDSFRFRFGF